MGIKDWFPLGWTGWISLKSKGLSKIFSNTTVQKHQFFSTQQQDTKLKKNDEIFLVGYKFRASGKFP